MPQAFCLQKETGPPQREKKSEADASDFRMFWIESG